MGEKERADLDWLYRRDPETVAKDAAKADAAGRAYTIPTLPHEVRTAGGGDVDGLYRPSSATPSSASASASASPAPSSRPATGPGAGGAAAGSVPPRRIEPAPASRPREIPADAPVRHPLPSAPRTTAAAVTGRSAAPGTTAPGAPGAPRTATRAPRPRPRYGARRITALVVALVLLLGAYLVGVPLLAWTQVTRVDDSPSGKRPAAHPGTAVLLVGSDSRGELSDAEMKELGVELNDDDTGARTDTMMLLYTPPTGRSVLVSIPRDSWVDIPGYGEGKINAAFAIGGPELMVQTVEQATGFRVDGYAEVGFGGFARVVQALGGLDICVTDEVPGEAGYDTIKPGCQKLTAKQSLWFVRARHHDIQGDLGRAARQRQFMAALMKECLSPGVILNPAKYVGVTHAGAQGVALGQSTDMNETLAMAGGLRNISSGAGFSMVLPVANPDGWTTDGQSIVELDDTAISKLFAQLGRGDTKNLEQYVR